MKKILFFVFFSLFSVSSLFGKVTLIIENVTGTTGTNVSVPINVEKFNDVGAISLKIEYDSSILTYVGFENEEVQFISNAVDGEVILGWFDFTGTSPLNLGNAKLVDLIFAYSGGTSNLIFNKDESEIADANGIPLDDSYKNGSVSGSNPPSLPAPTLNSPADGATNQDLELTLDWSYVPGAATYGVQVATDASFFNIFINSGTVLNAPNYTIQLGILDFNTTYYWRANAASPAETSYWSEDGSFTTVIDVGVSDLAGIPEKFELLQNYPNPFNPSTTIRYGIPENSSVRISVVNMLGEVVDELLNTHQSAGYYEIQWNTNNISSGTYIYKIVAIGLNGAEFLQTKKMILLR